MPPIPDPYRVLGVAREATAGEIRTAHRRLAKQYHPDATGGDTERFLAVQEAYQVLSDPLRRREWDARHRPGPVRADTSPRTRPTTTRGGTARGATTGRGQPQASPAGDANTTGPGPRPARNPRTQSNRQRRRPDPFSPSGREPTSDSYTWSAQDVPWWSSGPDRSRPGQGADGTAGTTRPAADPVASPAQGTTSSTADTTHRAAASGADFDVYNRSSGAAWSMASRAYFRRAGSDVPRGAAEPFGQRWTTPPGTPSRGPGPSPTAARAAAAASRAAAAAASRPAAAPRPASASSSAQEAMGRARGVVFGPPRGSASRGRSGRAGTWPSLGGRLLYAVLGWLAPAAVLTLGPFVVAMPVVTGALSALAVALLLAPRLAYLAAVGGMAALVAGAGFALGQAVSADQLGVPFDAIAAAVVTLVYLGAVILACLDWPIARPWASPG
jgi:curved DNA-binding protein CbpA